MDAEKLLRQVYNSTKRALGPLSHSDPGQHDQHASVIHTHRRLPETEELAPHVYDAEKRTLGSEHHDTMLGLAIRAVAIFLQGRIAEGDMLFRLVGYAVLLSINGPARSTPS